MSTQTPDVLDGAEILANLKGKQPSAGEAPSAPFSPFSWGGADVEGFQDAVTKN